MARRSSTSTTTTSIRLRSGAAWPATAFPSSSTSTARKPTAWSSNAALQRRPGRRYGVGELRLRRSPGGDEHQHQPAVSAGPAAAAPAEALRLRARVVRARPGHRQRQRAHRRRAPRQQLPVAAHGSQRRRAHRDHHRHHGESGLHGRSALGVDVRVHERADRVRPRATTSATTEYESALGYPGLPRSFVAGARFRSGGPASQARASGRGLGTRHLPFGTGTVCDASSSRFTCGSASSPVCTSWCLGHGAALVFRIDLQRAAHPHLFTPRAAGPLADPVHDHGERQPRVSGSSSVGRRRADHRAADLPRLRHHAGRASRPC